MTDGGDVERGGGASRSGWSHVLHWRLLADGRCNVECIESLVISYLIVIVPFMPLSARSGTDQV